MRSEVGLGIAVLVLVASMQILGAFRSIEEMSLDLRYRSRPPGGIDQGILLVYITDDCIGKLGKWPWKRSVHRQMIERLSAAGARSIGFDVLFIEEDPADPAGDAELVAAASASQRVVVPLHLMQTRQLDIETGDLVDCIDVIEPFPKLAQVAQALGFVSVDYERHNADGVVRRVPLIVARGTTLYPSFPLAVAAAGGEAVNATAFDRVAIGTSAVPLTWLTLGLDWKGWRPSLARSPTLLVNYRGDAMSGRFATTTCADLLAGLVPPEQIRGRFVLIGPSAAGLSDIKMTPLGLMPGVLIHAHALSNLTRRDFAWQTGLLFELVTLGGLALVIGFLNVRFPRERALLGATLIVGGWWFAANSLFRSTSVAIPVVAPMVLVVVQSVLTVLVQFVVGLRQSNRELQRTCVELDQQVTDLSTLNRLGNRLLARLDLDQMAGEILGNFRDQWSASRLALIRFEGDQENLRLLAHLVPGEPPGSPPPLIDRALEGRLQTMPGGTRECVQISDNDLFNVALPLPFGNGLWGAILLRTDTAIEPLARRTDFWSTQLALASTALENARLYNLATVDGLTKLFVRRYFQLQLESECHRARRYQRTFALVMTDIDHFKRFNDTYGHQQGDLVLSEVAAMIKQTVRQQDIACRYGGEEFGVILPETSLDGARIVAERMRVAVAGHQVPRLGRPGEMLKVSISLGVAGYPAADIGSPDELIARADACLYRAKENGRNRVEVAEPAPPMAEPAPTT